MNARLIRSLAATAVATVAAMALAASAFAAPALDGSFPVKGIDTNSKIVAGPDGNMWVTLAGAGNNVARVTPAGGVEEFELGLLNASGIAVGPEGKLWVTGTNAVASFSASDPKGTVDPTTILTIAGNSPIVAGPDGNIWVASQEIVLRIPPGDPGKSTPFPSAELSPRDIAAAGSLLAVSDAGAKNRIATFTTDGVEQDFAIGGGSQGVAGGPGGQIAFSAPGAVPEQVGLISPPNPATSSELLNDPFGVDFGSDGAYWIAQFSGEVTRMTTAGDKSSIPGLPKESPRQIAAGPNNTMWVTLSKNEEEGVARISGLEPPLGPAHRLPLRSRPRRRRSSARGRRRSSRRPPSAPRSSSASARRPPGRASSAPWSRSRS